MVDIANDTSTGAELDLVNGEGTFNDVFEDPNGDTDWIKVVVDQSGSYDVALTGGNNWGNFSIAMSTPKGFCLHPTMMMTGKLKNTPVST